MQNTFPWFFKNSLHMFMVENRKVLVLNDGLILGHGIGRWLMGRGTLQRITQSLFSWSPISSIRARVIWSKKEHIMIKDQIVMWSGSGTLFQQNYRSWSDRRSLFMMIWSKNHPFPNFQEIGMMIWSKKSDPDQGYRGSWKNWLFG